MRLKIQFLTSSPHLFTKEKTGYKRAKASWFIRRKLRTFERRSEELFMRRTFQEEIEESLKFLKES